MFTLDFICTVTLLGIQTDAAVECLLSWQCTSPGALDFNYLTGISEVTDVVEYGESSF